MSEVHNVRLSLRSCIINVLSLYDSSLRVSNSEIASSNACLARWHALKYEECHAKHITEVSGEFKFHNNNNMHTFQESSKFHNKKQRSSRPNPIEWDAWEVTRLPLQWKRSAIFMNYQINRNRRKTTSDYSKLNNQLHIGWCLIQMNVTMCNRKSYQRS